MYKLDPNKKFLPINIKELNKNFENKNSNFKIDSVKNLENYYKKFKK